MKWLKENSGAFLVSVAAVIVALYAKDYIDKKIAKPVVTVKA
jgi:hypothetical protein